MAFIQKLLLYLNIFLLMFISANTTTPIWVSYPNIEIQSCQIINGDITSLKLQTITVSFSLSFNEIPHFAFGISGLQQKETKLQKCFSIDKQEISSSSFSLKFHIKCSSQIWFLQIMYFALSSLFPHHLNIFQNVSQNFEEKALINFSSSQKLELFKNQLNYTKQALNIKSKYQNFNTPFSNIKIALLTSALTFSISNNQLDLSNHFGLAVSSEVINQTYYKIEVVTRPKIVISELCFTIIIFDKYDIQLSRSYALFSQTISIPSSIRLPTQKIQNFFIGFVGWSHKRAQLQNQNIFHRQILGESLFFQKQVEQRNLVNYEYTMIHLKMWKCPLGMFLNQKIEACANCSIGCINCLNSAHCTDCYQQNFYLDNGECIQINKIMMGRNLQEELCLVNNCLRCNSLDQEQCEICITNYYLSSSDDQGRSCLFCNSSENRFINSTSLRCQFCTLNNCLVCSSLTACSACNTTNSYYLNGSTCSYCNATQNRFINGTSCQACSLTQCITCSSLAACSACNTTNSYYLNGSTCSYCNATQNRFINGTTCQILQNCNINNCISCSSQTTCSVCNTTNSYYLNGSTCSYCDPNQNKVINLSTLSCELCTGGLFVNTSSQTCQSCSLVGCTSCLSLVTCSSCDFNSSYFLSGQTCMYCDPSLNQFINPSSLACEQCTIQGCLVCSSLSFCLICHPNYSNSTPGTCVAPCPASANKICSDNTLDPNEECDDGNSVSGDGCSSSCTIEPDFSCQSNTACNSVCYYQGAINLSILYIEKKEHSNQIEVRLQLSPNKVSLWDEVDFTRMVTLSNMNGFDNFTVVRNPDQTVSIFLNYNTNIHNREITVQLDPTKSGKLALSRLSSVAKTFLVKPHNNEVAFFYSEKQYQMAQVVAYLSSIIAGLSLLLFFMGIFTGKLVGLEMIAVVQIAVLGLISLPQLNPCFKALSSLEFVNGVNYFSLNKAYMFDQKTSNQIKGVKLLSVFIKNYNLNLLLFFVTYLISFVFFIASKATLKKKPELSAKLFALSKRTACEVLLNFLLFTGYICGVSMGIYLLFGFDSLQQIQSIFNTIELIVLIILNGLYFTLLLKLKPYFGQFIRELTNNSQSRFILCTNAKISDLVYNILSKWYNFLILERIIIGSSLPLLSNYDMGLLLPICMFILFLVLSIVFRPYNTGRNNPRFAANILISITILGIYLCYRWISIQEKNSETWMLLPMVICVLLLICIIYSVICLVCDLYSNRRNQDPSSELTKNSMVPDQTIRQSNNENLIPERALRYNQIAKRIKKQIQIEKKEEIDKNGGKMNEFIFQTEMQIL